MFLQNLQEAQNALTPYIPSAEWITGRDITLERMWPMMEILGNPEKKLRIIHVAGTSGKTSTCYYISKLLEIAGLKVGLHVSPHIDKITERVQINNKPVSDELFCQELGIFLDIIHNHGLQPTYFELLIGFVYWFFDRQNVDYVVMETGMGGLHDGTNVATNIDKICVITDIGLDHTKFLGNTIPKIAYQKAGIIQPHNTVLMYEQSAEIMEVFRARCIEKKAELITTTQSVEALRDTKILDRSLPLYQQRNWMLAYFVVRHLKAKDSLPAMLAKQILESQHIQVPARMDITHLGSKKLIMDGAHNQQKMEAFVKSFKAMFPGQKCALLLSIKEGKDYKGVIECLLEITDYIIATTFKTSQDLPVIAMDSHTLAMHCQQAGIRTVRSIPDQQTAYAELRKAKEKLLVITGSFYLIYQLRATEAHK